MRAEIRINTLVTGWFTLMSTDRRRRKWRVINDIRSGRVEQTGEARPNCVAAAPAGYGDQDKQVESPSLSLSLSLSSSLSLSFSLPLSLSLSLSSSLSSSLFTCSLACMADELTCGVEARDFFTPYTRSIYRKSLQFPRRFGKTVRC